MIKIKPFIKWAGGKSQLLADIKQTYPKELGKSINRYCEPFIGGGAVLFDILSNYQLDEIYISDINAELINTYHIIKTDVESLINGLEIRQDDYLSLDLENRKKYYYKMRECFNTEKSNNKKNKNVDRAILFIFLNHTCFNGLYRVNSKGMFNVPVGSYKKPLICDATNLLNVSDALKNVTIQCGDYRESGEFIDKNTFVYLDPPYRPLNATASFTAYTENQFGDQAQRELASFINDLNDREAKVVLSNSDPKNENEDDNFFDDLYKTLKINRITAKRMINCNGDSRGNIKELLITNS